MFIFKLKQDRGGTVEFDDLAKAILWVQDEIGRWAKAVEIADLKGRDTPFTSILSGWSRAAAELQHIRSGRKASTAYEIELTPDDLVTHESIVGQSLQNVAYYVGSSAADAAALSTGIGSGTVSWAEPIAVAGVVAFDRFYRGLQAGATDEMASQLSGVSKTAATISIEYQALAAKMEGLSAKVDGDLARADGLIAVHEMEAAQKVQAAVTGIQTRSAELEQQFVALQDKLAHEKEIIRRSSQEQNSIVEAALNEGREKIDTWVAAQMEQTRIEAPVALWSARAKTHTNRAKGLRAWAIVIGITGIIASSLISIGAFQLAHWLFDDAAGNPSFVDGQLSPTFYFEVIFASASTLLWLTMFIWSMRILLRQYTTEDRLAIDASARSAMTQTYLGLIKEGGASEAERAIVLDAIFRPVSERPSADDGPPSVSLPALIAALASGKSGT